MLEVSIARITWDSEGMDPVRDCGLPVEAILLLPGITLPEDSLARTGHGLADLLNEPIAMHLHNRYGFNVTGYVLLDAIQVDTLMDNETRSAQWGSHPQHFHPGAGPSAAQLGQLSRDSLQQAADSLAQQATVSLSQQVAHFPTRTISQGANLASMSHSAPDWTVNRRQDPFQPRRVQRLPEPTAAELADFLRRTGNASAVRMSNGAGGVGALAGAAVGAGGNAGGPEGSDAPEAIAAGFLRGVRECRVRGVVLLFKPIVQLRGVAPRCPVCDSEEEALRYQITLLGGTDLVTLQCDVCQLLVQPQANSFELHFGGRHATVMYHDLGKKPEAAFMEFAEELFRWRQDYRTGSKKKSRQLVLLAPQEESEET